MAGTAQSQRLERVLCRAGGRQAHDRAGTRQDHQYRLGAERIGAAWDRALHRDQGRGPQSDARHVYRLGAIRVADQRHRARLFQDAAQPGAGRQPGIHRLA